MASAFEDFLASFLTSTASDIDKRSKRRKDKEDRAEVQAARDKQSAADRNLRRELSSKAIASRERIAKTAAGAKKRRLSSIQTSRLIQFATKQAIDPFGGGFQQPLFIDALRRGGMSDEDIKLNTGIDASPEPVVGGEGLGPLLPEVPVAAPQIEEPSTLPKGIQGLQQSLGGIKEGIQNFLPQPQESVKEELGLPTGLIQPGEDSLSRVGVSERELVSKDFFMPQLFRRLFGESPQPTDFGPPFKPFPGILPQGTFDQPTGLTTPEKLEEDELNRLLGR